MPTDCSQEKSFGLGHHAIYCAAFFTARRRCCSDANSDITPDLKGESAALKMAATRDFTPAPDREANQPATFFLTCDTWADY